MTSKLPGLTNIVQWSDAGGVASVIRQGRPFAAALGIDRLREAQVLRRILHLDIGPELLSMDVQCDRTVFRAIPGTALDCCPLQPIVLEQSLAVLSLLHSQPEIGRPFAASSLIRHYLSLTPISSTLREFCEHQAELSEKLERSVQHVLCHNDCVAKNWILTPDGGVKLVDFEFAAPNDPAFDVATWCIDFDVNPRNPIMTAYKGWEPAFQRRVHGYFSVVDTLWALYCRCLADWTTGSVQEAVIAQLRRRVDRLGADLV